MVKMKVLMIGSPYDPSNPLKDQTVAHYISSALENNGASVIKFTPERLWYDKLLLFKKAFYRAIGKRYFVERTELVFKHLAKQINNKIQDTDHDFVFSFGSMPHVFLNHKKPFAFWTDATFNSLKNYYSSYTNVEKYQSEFMFKVEKEVFENSYKMFFASDWASKSAINDYDINPDKVITIPFGANLPEKVDDQRVQNSINDKLGHELEMIWIGVDWERKGGDILISLARAFNEMDVKCKFNIVGLTATAPADVKNNFIFHGFLSKNNQSEFNKLKELFYRSHFHILPTKAEAFGHVFAEANAFALPNIAFRTGGVPTAINAGKNGYLFNLETSPKDIAEFVASTFKNKEEYVEICRSSKDFYENEINWDSSIRKILNHINL